MDDSSMRTLRVRALRCHGCSSSSPSDSPHPHLAPPAHAASLPLGWSAEHKASANDVYNAVATGLTTSWRRGLREAGRLGNNGLLLLPSTWTPAPPGRGSGCAPAAERRGKKVAVDARGNVIVDGDREPSNGLRHRRAQVLVSGVLKWRTFYDGPDHRGDYVTVSRSTPAATRLWSGPPSARAPGRTTSPQGARRRQPRLGASLRRAGLLDSAQAWPSIRPAASTSPAARGASRTYRAGSARPAPSPSSTARRSTPLAREHWAAPAGRRRGRHGQPGREGRGRLR